MYIIITVNKIYKNLISNNHKMRILNAIRRVIMDLKKSIRSIENFPKEGISFKDITTLMQDLCKSEMWTMRKPSNASGSFSSEMV